MNVGKYICCYIFAGLRLFMVLCYFVGMYNVVGLGSDVQIVIYEIL